MKIENCKLSKIKPNKANPRVIKDNKFHLLVKSILVLPKMLELRPIVVNSEMVVLGGNMRLRALEYIAGLTEAERLQIMQESNDYNLKPTDQRVALVEYWNKFQDDKIVPFVKADEMTDAEQREFIVKDNASFGEWDWDMLANEWDVEELTDWGMENLDFDIKEEKPVLEAEEDDFDEEKDEIEKRCSLGDVWQLGENRLMCGDSTKYDDVKKLMNGELADMVFTDPPYDLEDIKFFGNIRESTKEDCHIFCMSSDKHILRIASENIDIFKKFFSVDFRCAHIVSNNQPMTRVDLVAEFNKGKNRFVNTRDGFTTLIECPKIHSDKIEQNFGHKQAKRVELPAKFIEHYSNENDVVLDLFGGIGTTLIACEQMKRKCVMMEYNEHYADIIIARWEKMTGNKAKKIS